PAAARDVARAAEPAPCRVTVSRRGMTLPEGQRELALETLVARRVSLDQVERAAVVHRGLLVRPLHHRSRGGWTEVGDRLLRIASVANGFGEVVRELARVRLGLRGGELLEGFRDAPMQVHPASSGHLAIQGLANQGVSEAVAVYRA